MAGSRVKPGRLGQWCAAVLVLVGVLLLATPAGAHNALESTEPPEGATVASDAHIVLRFVADVPLDTVSVEGADPSGRRFELTGLEHGATEREIVVPLADLAPGQVTLRWRLVGGDGHVLTERLAFTIVAPATAAPQVTAVQGTPGTIAASAPTQTPETNEADWLALTGWLIGLCSYVAMIAVLGLAMTSRFVWSGALATPALRQLPVFGLSAIALLAAVQLGLLAADIRQRPLLLSLDGLDVALQTTAGVALVVRAIVAVAAAVGFMAMARRADERARAAALLAPCVVLLATWSLGGHAWSMRWPMLGVPVDVAHHAAAATWLGGLIVVGSVALRVLDTSDAERVAQRFSSVAASAVAVLAITGLTSSIRLVDSVGDLVDPHSRILAAKLAVLAAMLWVANHNRKRLQRWRGRRQPPSEAHVTMLRRAMTTEFAAGVVIIALTAVLVRTTPTLT